MRTLWVFGDSFSVDFENNNILNFIRYRDIKGYYPKTWGKILSEDLNFAYQNHAEGGVDNHTILESFCDHIRDIKPGDVVFVGWSPKERMRLVNGDGKWRFINANSPHNLFPDISEENLQRLLANRIDKNGARDVIEKEIKSWENMIRYTMKDMTLHIWEWYDQSVWGKNYQTIRQETNGLINDDHWGEQGHIQYVKDLYNRGII